MMRLKKNITLVFVACILLLAIVVRFSKLDTVPSSLFFDEIDMGYQAKSLLATGKDYRGSSSPFFFRSVNSDRTPLPILATVLSTSIFKSPEYQVRGGIALAGVIVVLLSMLFSLILTKRKTPALITGIVFAFSPWQIQFSRIAFEAEVMLMILFASLIVFLYWIASKKTWAFFLSAFLLGLNVYTYRTMSLFAPLTVLLLLCIYYKDFFKVGTVKVLLWLSVIGMMVLPFLYATTIGSADQPRIAQISVFSDPMIPINVMRNRELDSGDFTNPEIGKKPIFSSLVFHNKVLTYLTEFGKNYYRNFSTEFLFISGDSNRRHTPLNSGELLFVDIVGLISGFVFISKNLKFKKYKLLLCLFLLSPVPSDLTMDGANHASRLVLMSGPLLLIVGLGYAHLFNFVSKNRKYILLIPIIASIWSISTVINLHNYFIHYPIDSSRQFGYGYKKSVEKINELKDQYKFVRITNSNDPPILYYLYWSNINPKEVQEYGMDFGENSIKNKHLDSIKPFEFKDLCDLREINKLNKDTMYLVSYNDFPIDLRTTSNVAVPAGIKLLSVFKYPDNEVAYYLITRDVKDGKEVVASENVNCKK